MSTDARTALATRRDNGGQVDNTLTARINRMGPQFQMAMPKGAEATQLVRDALTCLRMNPKLGECDPESVLGSLMTCAQLGLRPGVLGHAWLLPFWDRKANADENGRGRGGYRAQLVVGYQGLIDLGHRSGQIASLIARTVYRNDTFDVDYGLADALIHKPALFVDRGDPIAYYAIAKFTSGGHAFVVMTHLEMVVYRDRHATAKDRNGKVFGPWVDHFEGMAHKTCIRQLAKYMPKSTELANALAADGGVRLDASPAMPALEATRQPDTWDGEVVDQPAAADGEVATAAEQDTTQPPNTEAHPLDDVQSKPRLLTKRQQGQIMALAAEIGLTDRDARLDYISGTVDRKVASSSELTTREIGRASCRARV